MKSSLLSLSSLEPVISLDLVLFIFSTNPMRCSKELHGGPNFLPHFDVFFYLLLNRCTVINDVIYVCPPINYK